MPRYMVTAKLTNEGLAGSIADGWKQREATSRAAWESVGATMEAYYLAAATDPWDVVTIVSAPNTDAVYALAAAVVASGAASSGTCIELRTADEADAVLSRQAAYRRPGT